MQWQPALAKVGGFNRADATLPLGVGAYPVLTVPKINDRIDGEILPGTVLIQGRYWTVTKFRPNLSKVEWR